MFGRHPGRRALHAKGILCKATFTATPEAGKLTRAAHMQGDSIPATVRLSNGGGNPNVPDYKPDVRGLAVKLYLPDGSRTDIVAQSVPRFPVRTPEAFVEPMLAQRPEPAIAWRMPLFLARHPATLLTLPPGLPALRPIVSNNFVRGGVTGLGLVNLVIGFADLSLVFTARARPDIPLGEETSRPL